LSKKNIRFSTTKKEDSGKSSLTSFLNQDKDKMPFEVVKQAKSTSVVKCLKIKVAKSVASTSAATEPKKLVVILKKK